VSAKIDSLESCQSRELWFISSECSFVGDSSGEVVGFVRFDSAVGHEVVSRFFKKLVLRPEKTAENGTPPAHEAMERR
jgi:hypothetical protein